MHITIFLNRGETLRFEKVTNLKKDEKFYDIITFNYLSASDGEKKRAAFSTRNVLGLSVNKEDFDVNSLF